MKSPKQHIASWLLLLAFMPMWLVSSVHIHNKHSDTLNVDTDCYNCVHKSPCAGHLNLNGEHSHNCVLCQFMCMNYAPNESARFYIFVADNNDYKVYNIPFSSTSVVGLPQFRAPPM